MSSAARTGSAVLQDVIVLGAGVSGLAVAHELARQGRSVVLIDEYPNAGGNHLSRNVDGYTFDIGAIFFWTSNPLFRLFPGVLAACQTIPAYRTRRITPLGRVARYPFDLRSELFDRPPAYVATALFDALRARLSRRRGNAADFARYYIGARLLEDSGLAAYMGRFYGFPMDEISHGFAERRMQWIAANASLRQIAGRRLRRRPPAIGPEPSCVVRPRSGFPDMYAPAVAQLRAAGVEVRLGERLTSISGQGGRCLVRSDGGEYAGRRLISTVPLAKAMALAGVRLDEAPESSTLTTLCCRFRGDPGFESTVLYNFHRQGLWKRLTMHSDSYGMVDGWRYLSVEATSRGVPIEVPALFADFRRMTAKSGLFDGELELVDAFETGFAYPIYDLGAEARKVSGVASLAKLGIETLGRQGAFDYLPSSAQAIDLALEGLGQRPAA